MPLGCRLWPWPWLCALWPCQHPCSTSPDLGVIVDNRLNFSTHISNNCCKAHKRANLIIRCFHSKTVSSLITAFKVYVRPILEYCSVVWKRSLIKDIDAIEAVQRMFTKRLPGMKHLTCHQRLVKLELERLELRRVRTDLLSDCCINNALVHFVPSCQDTCTRFVNVLHPLLVDLLLHYGVDRI